MTRIFENMKEAINEIERDIMEMGIAVHPHSFQNKNVKDNKDFSTLEVQNYSFSILNMLDKNKVVGQDLKWCQEEFKERIKTNFINPGEAWKLREHIWEEFLVDGKMDYTYNERMNAFEQIELVIAELSKNPDTRQAIIHIHNPRDVRFMQTKRIPCSLTYQLMIRRNALDIIYNMRSSDFYTHFKNDIWLADELRNYITKWIDQEPGIFHMNIGSLHIYKNYTKKHVF